MRVTSQETTPEQTTIDLPNLTVPTLAAELGIAPKQVEATIALLDEGNTVPFIARYRKEVTGGLDDTQLRTLASRLEYLRDLTDRKRAILAAIDEQGKLTPELRQQIAECDTKARLEDLYLPYKKRRVTKADKARAAGLEPLTDAIIAAAHGTLSEATLRSILGDDGFDALTSAQRAALLTSPFAPEAVAEAFTVEEFPEVKDVLDGARAIVIDRLALDADLVGTVREKVWNQGAVHAGVVEGKETDGAAYRDYFDYTEPLTQAPSHRVLAILRGEREGMLTVDIDPGEDEDYTNLIALDAKVMTAARAGADAQESAGGAVNLEASAWLAQAIQRGWRTKINLSASLDARMRLKERAEETAVQVFATNLKDVLLAAPAGRRATLGLDPGYRNGVKCAAVDTTGKVTATMIVHPHQPQNRWSDAVAILTQACIDHNIELIAIGNGTASRETDTLAREVADAVAAAGHTKPIPVVVSESGASVYSASELAAKEFPDMDVSLRGAVSIARRLQDPLAELVKVDPKSIGVGQYQHDVNQSLLAAALDAVVEDAVNSVGVDVNTASAPLLGRVAGISSTLAENIVAYREKNGAFATRTQLLDVPRLGPKAYEQCAGFLRIRGGDQPLDASAVHPESYPVVSTIAAAVDTPVEKLIGNSALLAKIRPADFAQFGVPTVTDILAELDKPGRDPRPEFKTATFKEGVSTIGDLTPGMVLEGTVTNVAAFGAFVDIGVHQDGLVHVSELADRFVRDPHEVVKSGQVVRVTVVDVDVERHRIGLSMRSDALGEGRRGGSGRGAGGGVGRGDGSGSGAGRGAGRGGQSSGTRGDGSRRGGDRDSDGRRLHHGRHTDDRRGGGRGRSGGSAPAAGGSLADALRRAGFGN